MREKSAKRESEEAVESVGEALVGMPPEKAGARGVWLGVAPLNGGGSVVDAGVAVGSAVNGGSDV